MSIVYLYRHIPRTLSVPPSLRYFFRNSLWSVFPLPQSEYTRVSIDGSLFNENYARNNGGGVHMGNGQVSVVDSLFFNNVAGSSNVDDGEQQQGW